MTKQPTAQDSRGCILGQAENISKTLEKICHLKMHIILYLENKYSLFIITFDKVILVVEKEKKRVILN